MLEELSGACPTVQAELGGSENVVERHHNGIQGMMEPIPSDQMYAHHRFHPEFLLFQKHSLHMMEVLCKEGKIILTHKNKIIILGRGVWERKISSLSLKISCPLLLVSNAIFFIFYFYIR